MVFDRYHVASRGRDEKARYRTKRRNLRLHHRTCHVHREPRACSPVYARNGHPRTGSSAHHSSRRHKARHRYGFAKACHRNCPALRIPLTSQTRRRNMDVLSHIFCRYALCTFILTDDVLVPHQPTVLGRRRQVLLGKGRACIEPHS